MKQKRRRRRRAGRAAGRILGLLCLLLAAFLLYCHITAVTVHLRRTVITSVPVPEQLSGLKILYLTDPDVHIGLGIRAFRGLAESLAQLEPDVLILGGDLASPLLFTEESSDATDSRAEALLEAFSVLDPPLGKYLVTGEEDGPFTAILARKYGFTVLDGTAYPVGTGQGRLCLLGVGAGGQTASAASDDFVIAVAHDPADVIPVLTAEASDGGPLADLILCGHTHGGQIRIGERTLLSFDSQTERVPTGWHDAGGIPILHSCGIGCQGALLRLGTQAEAHLISLQSAD